MDNFDSEKFIIINGQNTDLKIIDSNTKSVSYTHLTLPTILRV